MTLLFYLLLGLLTFGALAALTAAAARGERD
jgi:hypothetical protein